MNDNHKLEKTLADLGAERVPPDVHDMTDQLMDDFRNRQSAVRPLLFRLKKYRPLITASAAAAAVVIALIGLWPISEPPGIAWADVARRIQASETVCGWSRTIYPDRERSFNEYVRFYMKDSFLERFEFYEVNPATRPVSSQPSPREVRLRRGHDADWSSIIWYASKRVNRQKIDNCLDYKENRVASIWYKLRQISSDGAYYQGVELLDGQEMLVYLAPIEYLIDDDYAPDKGTVRVWVSKETKLPVRCDMCYVDFNDRNAVTSVYDLQWNEPLSDDLFDPPDFGPDWTFTDRRSYCFGKKTLRPGISLDCKAPDGTIIATRDDVMSINGGIESLNPNGDITEHMIEFDWTDSAAKRIYEYMTQHGMEDQSLTLIFAGGRIMQKVPTGYLMGPLRARKMTFDIDRLDMSLEEFEQKYLVEMP